MGSTFADSDFADSEFEETLDTQLTLGTGSLLTIFFGLVMICGIFFGFGYTLGRRNFSQAAMANTKAPAAPPQPAKTIIQPPPADPPAIAAAPSPAAPPTQAVASSALASAPAKAAIKTPSITNAPAAAPMQVATLTKPAAPTPVFGTGPNPVAPVHIPKPSAIHPVLIQPRTNIPYLNGVSMPANPSNPTATPWVWTPPFDVHRTSAHTGTFRPRVASSALPTHVAMTIQIAALSREDDAEVLASALRKGGFIPSIHNDTDDSLYHVQVGPYERTIAMAARQRLIARGYNAVLK